MKPTPDQIRILRGLYTLHQQYGVGAMHAYLTLGGGEETISLEFDLDTDELPDEVRHLHRDLDMLIVDPLRASGYIEMREIGRQAYRLWITTEGRSLVERNFEEISMTPAGQFLTFVGSWIGNMPVSGHGPANVTSSPVTQSSGLPEPELGRLLAELTEAVDKSGASTPKRVETRSNAVQLAAELSKPQPEPSRVSEYARALNATAAGMREIEVLAQRLVEEAESGSLHHPKRRDTALIRLAPEAERRLYALARYANQDEQELAAKLLAAALTDVIEALPDEPEDRRPDLLAKHIEPDPDEAYLGPRSMLHALVEEIGWHDSDADVEAWEALNDSESSPP